MITAISIRDSKKYADAGWDVLVIVRNPGKFGDYIQKTEGLYYVPVLSPSQELTLKAKELRDAGKLDQKTFHTEIADPFLKELVVSDEAKNMLNRISKASKGGRKIALACFCQDPDICHRSVVAGLLQAVGNPSQGIAEYSPYMFDYLVFENREKNKK